VSLLLQVDGRDDNALIIFDRFHRTRSSEMMGFSLTPLANTTKGNAPIAKDGCEPIAAAHQASTDALIVTAFIVWMKQRRFEYGNWIQLQQERTRTPTLCCFYDYLRPFQYISLTLFRNPIHFKLLDDIVRYMIACNIWIVCAGAVQLNSVDVATRNPIYINMFRTIKLDRLLQ